MERQEPLPSDHEAQPDFAQIDRYLIGTASADDRAAVDAWLHRDPQARAYMEGLRSALAQAELPAISPRIIDQACDAILAESQVTAQEAVDLRSRVQTHRSAVMRVGGYVAAAMLALVAIVVVMRRPGILGAHSSAIRTFATVAGQRATVRLPDGSRAMLGPATTLSMTTNPSDAGLEARVVGQALFTVVHRPTHPFRVHTNRAVVQVLGTSFLVRQYATDSVVRVVVTEGRVSLSSPRESRVLTVRTLAVVDDSGRVQVTPNIAADEYTGWTTGQLVFRHTLLRDAVVELGRTYGVDIRVGDSALAARSVSWTIAIPDCSLTDVLDVLEDVLNAHAVRADRVITLVPGRANVRRPIHSSPFSSREQSYGK